jgi:hypothetical protein
VKVIGKGDESSVDGVTIEANSSSSGMIPMSIKSSLWPMAMRHRLCTGAAFAEGAPGPTL